MFQLRRAQQYIQAKGDGLIVDGVAIETEEGRFRNGSCCCEVFEGEEVENHNHREEKKNGSLINCSCTNGIEIPFDVAKINSVSKNKDVLLKFARNSNRVNDIVARKSTVYSNNPNSVWIKANNDVSITATSTPPLLFSKRVPVTIATINDNTNESVLKKDNPDQNSDNNVSNDATEPLLFENRNKILLFAQNATRNTTASDKQEELKSDALQPNTLRSPAISRWKKISDSTPATTETVISYLANKSTKNRLKERLRKITEERLTVKQIFRRYVESSTLHGFVYTCSNIHFMRRFIWACLMILGAIYFLIKLKEGILAYYSYPFTTLSTMEYVDNILPFPAVSFCAVNQLKYSKLKSSSLYKLYLDSRLPLQRNWTDTGYDIPGDMLVEELKNVSLSIEDLFKGCDWIRRDTDHPFLNHRNCSSKNFTMYFSESGKVCFSLNSGHLGHKRLIVDNAGLKHGFEILFDLHNMDIIPYHSFTGMQVIVHDQEDNPARNVGFLISPGFKTYVKLQRKETRNLPPPFDTNCGSKPLKYHEHYNQKACLLESLTDYVGKACGCREMFMPDNELSYCSLREIILCVYPAKESFDEFNIRERDCPIDCQIVQYEATVSEARFIHDPPQGIQPSLILTDVNKRNVSSHILYLQEKMSKKELDNYIEDNLIAIILFFGEMNKVVNVQIGTFGFYKLLGNMGGEIGLMLGASLLTFVEFIDLLFCLMYHQILRCPRKNKAEKNNAKEGTKV